MEVIENQDSAPEVVSPQETIQQEVQPQEAQEHKEVQSEDSEWIKNLRRDRKEALRRADEAEKRSRMQEELLQRMISQQQVASPQSVAPQEDIFSELAKEDYVPGEKVVRALKQQKEEFNKELQEIKKGYAHQQQNSQISELRREYSDFDQVVNPETLAILEETNPRLASLIAASGDPYNMAVQSYEYIKAKGLNEKVRPTRRAEETEKRIEQNKKTVQSPQVFDKRPIAQAFQLNEAMKKELQNEMYQYAQQAGMGY